jgi:UDP:flavonoid glycosyltransferase YjiC (YdhE family)
VRVLFTSTSGWGHVNPMVPLAQAFAQRGDEVLWAVPPMAAARLEADGFAVRAAGSDALEPIPELLRRHPKIAALPGPERPDHMSTTGRRR